MEPSGFTKISALGVEEQRVNVLVDLDERPPDLGDGFRVEIRVIVWEKDGVVKVPTSSLFRVGGDWAVYRVAGGRASRQVVQIGSTHLQPPLRAESILRRKTNKKRMESAVDLSG